MKIVETDYKNYEITYRCNDDFWLISHDEYIFRVRNLFYGENIFNSFMKDQSFNTNVFQNAIRINHNNSFCKNITFTIYTKHL